MSEDLCGHERRNDSCLQQQRRIQSSERLVLNDMAPAASRQASNRLPVEISRTRCVLGLSGRWLMTPSICGFIFPTACPGAALDQLHKDYRPNLERT